MNNRRDKKPSTLSLRTLSTISFWCGLFVTICGMAIANIQMIQSNTPPTFHTIVIWVTIVGPTTLGLIAITWVIVSPYNRWNSE